MLGRLLKYDLKNIFKHMWIFFVLLILFATFVRISSLFDDYLIGKILRGFSLGGMYAMIGNIFFNLIIRGWAIFNRKLFGNESYLTHTLPVNKASIFESKFLSTFITTLFSVLLFVLALVIAYSTNIFDTITKFLSLAGTDVKTIIILIVVILFLEMICIIHYGYLSMIIGHNKQASGTGKIFLIGLIIYLASETFMVITLLIGGLFNKELLTLFTSTEPSYALLIPALTWSVIAYGLICIILNVLCVIRFNKGVNVE